MTKHKKNLILPVGKNYEWFSVVSYVMSQWAGADSQASFPDLSRLVGVLSWHAFGALTPSHLER